jgi:ribosome-binding factor A
VLPDAFGSNAQSAATGTTTVSQRTERVDELLRQEIGSIITRDVADPRVGFATITSVETTPDLRHAKVWISVIGQPAEREATVAALRRAMPFVRHELGTRLRIKRIPDLHVHLDDTAERGTRVLQLLSELEAGLIPASDTPLGESLPTPVARLPHLGDHPDEPPSAARLPEPGKRRRRSGASGARPRGTGPRDGRRTTR